MRRVDQGGSGRAARFTGVMVGALLALTVSWTPAKTASDESDWEARRSRMVNEQLELRGISNEQVLEAMRAVPRHWFVPEELREHAYEDRPLPIGHRQTISQPYIVAAMTELLEPQPDDTILEVGTGSGYQAAVLAHLVKQVYSIEIVEELAERARRTLEQRGIDNVVVIAGDGYRGLPAHAPFDGIIVTAAPPQIPQPLIDQLAEGAHLVVPIGSWDQELTVLTRTPSGISRRSVFGVRFVPMTGEAQGQQRDRD